MGKKEDVREKLLQNIIDKENSDTEGLLNAVYAFKEFTIALSFEKAKA